MEKRAKTLHRDSQNTSSFSISSCDVSNDEDDHSTNEVKVKPVQCLENSKKTEKENTDIEIITIYTEEYEYSESIPSNNLLASSSAAKTKADIQ